MLWSATPNLNVLKASAGKAHGRDQRCVGLSGPQNGPRIYRVCKPRLTVGGERAWVAGCGEGGRGADSPRARVRARRPERERDSRDSRDKMLRCRTCLCVTAAPHTMPLFQADALGGNGPDPPRPSEPRLAALLAEVTQLQVYHGDSLPETICKACHTQLCTSQIFIKKARESYHILRNNLKKISMNGERNPMTESVPENPKRLLNHQKLAIVDNPDGNFKDICDEMGITIDNELKIDESVNNFRGDLSIIYDDKAVQVNFECEHHQKSRPILSIHMNGTLDLDESVDECNGDDNYDKMNECEIKQEPEDYPMEYDQTEPYTNSMHEDHTLTISQIKIEPLSECDALKFHQEVSCQSPPLHDNLEQLDEDMKYASPECEFIEEDIKPTEEELFAYADKINHLDNLDHKEENTATKSPHEYEVMPGNSLLSEYQVRSKKNCILCNKCFKTKKKLKQHVVREHSYHECIKCSECSMNFTNSIDFDKHKSIHFTPVFEFQCVLCNIDFDTDIQFKTHLGTHKEIILLKNGNEESTLCSKCNDSFNNLSELFTHILNVCGFSMTPFLEKISNNRTSAAPRVKLERISPNLVNDVKYNLDRNIKFEKKIEDANQILEKKLSENSCPHCLDKFSNLSSLRVHLKSHSSTFRKALDRSFVCTLCMFKFKRKDHLIRHLVNVHRVSSENRRRKLMLLL
ncbi:uncharacterized protein LOC143917267 [Arctopsyche grandis]|uniref:uncharacterized protein LOC143917267 n=1 Tax=Arctopsyche grandis TaxID=121162 RepID=UPI00406D9AEC